MSLFYCSRAPRDRHPFPTRRSSDLVVGALITRSDAGLGERFPDPVDVALAEAGIGSRSEEHTSELQSLRHLVCRLLLEKKNIRPMRCPNRRGTVDDRKHPEREHGGI